MRASQDSCFNLHCNVYPEYISLINVNVSYCLITLITLITMVLV